MTRCPTDIAVRCRNLQRQVPVDNHVHTRLLHDTLGVCADLADVVGEMKAPGVSDHKDAGSTSPSEVTLVAHLRAIIEAKDRTVSMLQTECRNRAAERDAALAKISDLEQLLVAAQDREKDAKSQAESYLEGSNRQHRTIQRIAEAILDGREAAGWDRKEDLLSAVVSPRSPVEDEDDDEDEADDEDEK